ncbi:MAG: YqgE/AlgH family protein [Alphaproteobacteria bacterium]|nr:YqgE/AlgH family protein [Alphaproteobacteria bacterium]MCD8570992.1 YqgE/AlgH family protein [Alphaproteobacteria bacterium]
MLASSAYLSGKLLLAMPSMTDPRFARAVVFLCAHDAGGAMGVVINHKMPDVKFPELLTQIKVSTPLDAPKELPDIPVMKGGPVETARGFVLHDGAYKKPDTIKVDDRFGVTGTVDALKDIARGAGPQKMVFALGYAGWGAGQLDKELQDNAWLSIDATPDIVFDTDPADMWDKAFKTLGVDPGMLSGVAGRA